MTKNVIGSKIRQIRKRKNITQEMMIARLQSNGFDMSRSTYSKVELEIRQVRDIEIIQFAKALDIDVSELFK
ncbi:XRE family transcriptional regulator [Shewanella sp. Choline-02u-19]|nr:XRE family transcriptional regulator [Shewanella sp. Bg11-22]PKI29452.1 XRE family transcriptional regulator [Shewanella sp. Choline-02u-19]